MRSAWDETRSEHFTARHDADDTEDAVAVLEQLEGVRERLARRFEALGSDVAVVLHGTDAQLLLARPGLAVRRALTTPASRRYIVGAVSGPEIHVLSPRRLLERASNVADSREMLLLSPAALYARLVVTSSNPALRRHVRAARWAWLVAGSGAWLSGQSAHARPAIARRLREGSPPSFPPDLRDADLLGATVIDLLAREEGEAAVVALVTKLDPRGPRQGLVHAFAGRPLAHTEGTWRAHLSRLASAG